MAWKKKIGMHEHLSYNPERKPIIIVSDDVKRRLLEAKSKYRLKSFNDAIESLLNEYMKS